MTAGKQERITSKGFAEEMLRRLAPRPRRRMSTNVSSKTATASSSSPVLLDTFDRFHDYLRVSLTERCNLRCDYCMPSEGVKLTAQEELMSTDEILKVIEVFVGLGVRKVRLTGGEPTVRKDIVQLCSSIKALGVEQLAMTSNGIVLNRLLPQLQKAGLTHLNISLDTLDPSRFERITKRQGHERVMQSVHRALEMSFTSIKINCVVRKGVNEDELPLFVLMTKNMPVEVRFLEYMPFDENGWHRDKLFSYEDMLHALRIHFPDMKEIPTGVSALTTGNIESATSTAKLWRVPRFMGRVGFITAMTDEFCSTCNRLRLTADGKIKACLFGSHEVLLLDTLRSGGDLKSKVTSRIEEAVKAKQQRLGGHSSPNEIASSKNRPMILIGG